MFIDISTKLFPNTFTQIDDDDFEWISKFKWSAMRSGNTVYAVRRHFEHRKTVRLHRDIVRARSFEEVDHINSDGLDNRKENLRLCNTTENQQNRTKHLLGKGDTLYKGVFKRKNRSKPDTFFAFITIKKKRYNLGTFLTEIDAAKEYDSKALFYFGSFARLNFGSSETIAKPIYGVNQ